MNIWLVGGVEIISIFINLNSADEIILSVIPVLLGNGYLFKNITKEKKLELINTTGMRNLLNCIVKF